MKNRSLILLLIFIIAISLLTACTQGTEQSSNGFCLANNTTRPRNKSDPIKIATLSDAESGNLGQIIALALEDAGFDIIDENQTIASSTLLRETYQQNLADITIEYTGNAMYQMNNEGHPVWQDYNTGYEAARDYFKSNYNVDMLHPVKAKNSELLAVTHEFSEENNIKDMWDFADYVNNGGEIVLSTYNYWLKIDHGLPAFEEVYGFKIPKSNIITRDTDLKDLLDGKKRLNCAMVFTTEAQIEELGLYIIEDPENVSPIYSPAPIISSEVLNAHPEIEDILTPIFQSIDLEDLIKMNNKHQSLGVASRDVASEFLVEKGFIE